MLRNKRIVFHAAGLLFSHAQFFLLVSYHPEPQAVKNQWKHIS